MDPSLESLLTIAGAAPVVTILNAALIKAFGSGFNRDRFGPLLALALGVVVTLLAAAALGLTASTNIGQGVLTGIIAGASAIGLYETAKGSVLGH